MRCCRLSASSVFQRNLLPFLFSVLNVTLDLYVFPAHGESRQGASNKSQPTLGGKLRLFICRFWASDLPGWDWGVYAIMPL